MCDAVSGSILCRLFLLRFFLISFYFAFKMNGLGCIGMLTHVHYFAYTQLSEICVRCVHKYNGSLSMEILSIQIISFERAKAHRTFPLHICIQILPATIYYLLVCRMLHAFAFNIDIKLHTNTLCTIHIIKVIVCNVNGYL